MENCKELGKLAKEKEKEAPNEAIELYRQAADCFEKNNNLKDKNSNLEKSAKLLRKQADDTLDPRNALKIYIESAANYRQGNDEKGANAILADAAEKFVVKATEINKTQKTLVMALDNYVQAVSIYKSINLEEKTSQSEKKAQEICDMIGIPQDIIAKYLEGKGISSINISESPHATMVSDALETEHSSVDIETKVEETEEVEIMHETPDSVDDLISELEVTEEISEIEIESTLVKSETVEPESLTTTKETPIHEFETPDVEEKMSEPIIESLKFEKDIIEPEIETQQTPDEIPRSRSVIPAVNLENSEVDLAPPRDDLPPIDEEIIAIDKEITATDEEISESTMETQLEDQEMSEIEILMTDADNKTPEFLDKFDFEGKKGSSIKDRIKSELRGEDIGQSTDNEEGEKKTSDIENLFDDALDESMEDFLSGFEDIIIVEKQGGKPVITGPIIEILREQGYIKEDLSTEEELLKVPEYQILLLMIKEHPIPLEKLEEKTDLESVSMVVSNLQADNLIEQTNDYQWTISQKVKENIREFMSQSEEDTKSHTEGIRANINRNSKYEHLLIVILYKLGIIPELDVSVMELMQIPEFAAIKTIKDNEPVEFDIIKDKITDMPPVQVTRMLSRLEAEERITQTTNGQWKLADKFAKELILTRE